MNLKRKTFRNGLLAATAIVGLSAMALAAPASAQAREYRFDMPSQPLSVALRQYGVIADQQLIFAERDVRGRTAPALTGDYSADQALKVLLTGAGLKAERSTAGVLRIVDDSDPQGGSGDTNTGPATAVDELIVTAQKKEERVQDVPIAISAFSQKALEEQKIEGGFDLLKAIPNVTFSKNNFTGYNFSIRGIGTKSISATSDPGVAVSFNNTPLIQNRLFEQEYFDVERVEVLRGPQGTLYGRNATAGVINVISAKPDMNEFSGWLKGEVGNYDTRRLSLMANVPIVEDKLAIRLAGALTQRQGYDYNSVTKNQVNGRDLWSGRLTIGFNPTDRFRANLIWEHFDEDDDRSRTGKQLCHRDPGPAVIGSTPMDDGTQYLIQGRVLFSQGCKPGSLYNAGAFGTPNGLALPFVAGLIATTTTLYPIGYNSLGQAQTFIQNRDPYASATQSRDLRTIASFNDPRYRAKADVIELNFDFDITDDLTFTSQTAYDKDEVYSFQDYNRFNTQPVFADTSQFLDMSLTGPSAWANLAPGGVFCDPQLGCSDTLAGFDISQAHSEQFSQEFRLQSSFDGPLNFSLGANYTSFKSLTDYYVFNNLLTALNLMGPFYYPAPPPGGVDIATCPNSGFFNNGPAVPMGDPTSGCPYIDPNPIDSISGDGHNYFRSKNPYRLSSAGYFGELYWKVTDTLKVTAGLRYTDDNKTFTPVPSQLLLAPSVLGGGYISRGYPAEDPIKQHWGEFTGRLGVDWKPQLSFTDETMLYAFYSRGYKGGGANPPSPGFGTAETLVKYGVLTQAEADNFSFIIPLLSLPGVTYGPTFDPEFVNSFEIGAKNTLLDGSLQFNATAFFYDYKDYQVSQIKDRTAVNENFDATVWGLEFEALFAPIENLRLNANLGYLDTRIADGEQSIDIMDRTQSNPNYTLAKPWVQLPSNCVVPTSVVESWLVTNSGGGYTDLCGGIPGGQALYNPDDYPEINGGAGIYDELGGNELPNSPHWTMNFGAQYSVDLFEGEWKATLRGDAYWQSQSWARVYNSDPYDKLHGWYNVNLSFWLESKDGLKVEVYAKNLLDKTPITDAFLNSDDSALTTNVFVLDPRLIGVSVTKSF
jgi:iron complex outermembrane receptor protein